ncbi:MAG: FecR domain-containing protein [Bdellovibrionales bacterium]|nr:FecR domain-containing protein [Bdellovibrionales bacterium]
MKFVFRSVVLGLVFFSMPSAHAVLGKVVGQLGMVEGDVTVDNNPVKKTAQVHEGSVVEVKRGKATLILGKGNVFYLSADSKMVVNSFGVTPATPGAAGAPGAPAQENGELDLKFGRTRALIMNTSNEKKDLKIKARAATMGVRGTEIFIDAPKDTSAPINFFTLEGKADVKANAIAPPVAVAQNQGVSTQGAAAPAGAHNGAGSVGPPPAPPTMTMTEVKNEIKATGLDSKPITTPQDMRRQVTQQYMSDQFGMGALPPVVLDPLQDRFTPVRVNPRFCDATTGGCP